MFPSSRLTATSFLLLAKLYVANGVDTATVSITSEAQYEVEPACVKDCLYGGSPDDDGELYLLSVLGCAGTVYNECYCTQGQDQLATSYLSGCVNSLCSGTNEISPAVSFYESYCSVAGYPRNAVASQTTVATQTSSSPASTPVSQSATPTPSSPSPLTTPPVTSPPLTSTAASSLSSSNQSSSSSTTTSTSKSKSNTGAIVGGVVGGLAVLAFIVAVILFYLRSRRQKSWQTQHQEAAAASIHPPEKRTARPISPVSAKVAPTAVFKNPARGRAELLDKENETIVNVAPTVAEVNGDGRRELRPDELDANGRYIGELGGDGRYFTGSELP